MGTRRCCGRAARVGAATSGGAEGTATVRLRAAWSGGLQLGEPAREEATLGL